ncbi:MAG: hypothetical protein Q6K85_02720 [Thermostichus sp. DG02_1_bins_55]
MSICLILESAPQQAYFSCEQKSQINYLLWRQLYSEFKPEAIDQPAFALLGGQV